MTTEIELPFHIRDTMNLTVGDRVSISGMIFTAREDAIRRLHAGTELPFETKGHFLYHCGPIGKKSGKKWKAVSAPPDPSGLHEIYQGELMGRFGLRGIMGAGGTGTTMVAACRRFGACYFQTIPGAGLALGDRIQKVRGVHFRDDLDGREAVWELEVKDFPAVVTVDCHGRSLGAMIQDVSTRRFASLTE